MTSPSLLPLIDGNPLIEPCAIAAHEANRAYCLAIGDASQRRWHDAEAWQQESARAGVAMALAGASPEQQHDAWRDHKTRDGWVWGPTKDPAKKQHPCMMAYADLPEAQRRKDALYIAVVRAMAAALQP